VRAGCLEPSGSRRPISIGCCFEATCSTGGCSVQPLRQPLRLWHGLLITFTAPSDSGLRLSKWCRPPSFAEDNLSSVHSMVYDNVNYSLTAPDFAPTVGWSRVIWPGNDGGVYKVQPSSSFRKRSRPHFPERNGRGPVFPDLLSPAFSGPSTSESAKRLIQQMQGARMLGG